MYLDLSPLFSPVCEYSYACISHETVMNHAACNVETLNPGHPTVSTAQLVELTDDTFEMILREKSTAERQAGHGASTAEASSDTVGVGEQDEGVSGREVILIAS